MLQVIKAVLKDPGDTTQVLSRAHGAFASLTLAVLQLSLLFANQTEDDILCRSVRANAGSRLLQLGRILPLTRLQELDALAAEHSNLKASSAPVDCARRLIFAQVHYTLDRPTPGWSFSTGFITPEMVCRRGLRLTRSSHPAYRWRATCPRQARIPRRARALHSCGAHPSSPSVTGPRLRPSAHDQVCLQARLRQAWLSRRAPAHLVKRQTRGCTRKLRGACRHNAEALFLVDCGRERTFSSEGRGCDDVEAAFIGSRWWQPAASGSAATAPHAASACAHAALPPPPHAADRYG